MRLEPLFDMDLKYVGETVEVQPFSGEEEEWFGELEGTARGPKLNGTVRWANHARRREDGVWCLDVNGFVTTEDGAKILMTMRGYNIPRKPPAETGAVVATCTFITADSRYRWLNLVIATLEGERDEGPSGESAGKTTQIRYRALANRSMNHRYVSGASRSTSRRAVRTSSFGRTFRTRPSSSRTSRPDKKLRMGRKS